MYNKNLKRIELEYTFRVLKRAELKYTFRVKNIC